MSPGIAHVVLGLSPGGTERLVIELAKRTRTSMRGVICLDEPGSWAHELSDNGIPVVALCRRPGFSPRLGLEIARRANGFGASILHCHHYSPFVYGSIAATIAPGLRVVFTEHGRLSDEAPSKKRQWVNPVLSRAAGSIYAVSEDLKRHMVESGFPESVEVIHNGVEPGPPGDASDVRNARQAIGASDASFVIGTVARLDRVKDLATFLRAAALLIQRGHRLAVVVVGEGCERGALDDLAKELKIDGSVHFLGQRNDARRLVGGFDVYVNSSISEGISLTLLEAMAASRSIVATRVGGTPEVVVDGTTGLLVQPRAPEALAAGIEELLMDSSRRGSMGRAGRRRLEEEFSLDRMVDRYVRAYERAARS